MNTADRENTFWAEYSPRQTIPLEDCQSGHLYWVAGRSIGPTAVCRVEDGVVSFEGLREKMGAYSVLSENYRLDDRVNDTVDVFQDLGPGLLSNDKDTLRDWLILRDREFRQARINRLVSELGHYADLEAHEVALEQEQTALQQLSSL